MATDEFNRRWIIENGVPIVRDYGGNITVRALYYRLVAAGMTNSNQHYKRVVAAMGVARWDGALGFDAFQDHERTTLGETPYQVTDVYDEIENAKEQIGNWMRYYHKNRWENQPEYVEVFIEKKALQGVFAEPCRQSRVALSPCKGYPSLTFLHSAAARIQEAVYDGREATILYFGDYDPSGEDIPRSIQDILTRMGAEVHVERVLLLEEQVLKWGLPPAPTKMTDSRSRNWGGIGQVELDAVEPRKLKEYIGDAISNYFDDGLFSELKDTESNEIEDYRKALKDHVKTL